MKQQMDKGIEHQASAKALDLPISTKQSVELSKFLRYKYTGAARKILEEVIAQKRPVPFRRFCRDMGHKVGIAAGRYPQKAAREFLRLVKSAEANANAKGLDTSSLKIVSLFANRASIPVTGGRQRQGTKRTHLAIVVAEKKSSARKKQPATQDQEKPSHKSPKSVSASEQKQEAKQKAPATKPTEVKAEESSVKNPAQENVKPDPSQELSQESSQEPVLQVPAEQAKAAQTEVAQNPAEAPKTDKQSAHPNSDEMSAKQTKQRTTRPVADRVAENTPQDMLLKAEQNIKNEKASELQKEKTAQEVGQVENLFGELQQKGTLRGKK